MNLSENQIYLRPLHTGDREILARLANNKKIWSNVRDMFPHPYTIEDADDFIRLTQQENPQVNFAIEQEGTFCGVIGLTLQHDVYRKNAELGYWLGEEFWNKGIATRAVGLITTYGFDELGLARIYSGIFEYNLASMKVLEKNGFRLEGISYDTIYKNVTLWNEYRYAKSKITIIPIRHEDIPLIVQLVNDAYRGPTSKLGWTTEADLLEGLRVDESLLRVMLEKPGSMVLKYCDGVGDIQGCIYLEPQDKTLYVGLVTVSPYVQAKGIGKSLLRAAERHARLLQKDSLTMTVISVRDLLIAWYQKQGYQKTGEIRPFPPDAVLSTPNQPLELLVLEKKLYGAF